MANISSFELKTTLANIILPEDFEMVSLDVVAACMKRYRWGASTNRFKIDGQRIQPSTISH